MTQYTIRHIHLWPAFKFGLLVGAVVSFPPGLLFSTALRVLFGLLGAWLEGWEDLVLVESVLLNIRIDLVELLHLTGFLDWLQRWDDQGALFILGLTLTLVILGGLMGALLAFIAALTYNVGAGLSGGLTVDGDLVQGRDLIRSATFVPPAAEPEPQAKAAAYLVPRQPPEQRLFLRPGLTTVGSAPDNDLVLPALAPNHAEIRYDGDQYVLYPLQDHPVWVNQRPVTRANMLKDGFLLRLGSEEFFFHR